MTTKLQQLQRENESLREALETIADVLEEVGILENEEEEEEIKVIEYTKDPLNPSKRHPSDVRGVDVMIEDPPSNLPPEQNPSQHPEDDNPGD